MEMTKAVAADGQHLLRVREDVRVPTTGSINAVALCDGGKMLVAGGQDQVVQLWVIDKRMDRT